MARAYLRLDPSFFERKAFGQGYPPGAVAALIGVLCLAETQTERGHFRNERLLRALLEGYGKWVSLLMERGDLEALTDGRLYVVGWREWQEGDHTVGDRVRRIRARTNGAPAVVTDDTALTVTPAVMSDTPATVTGVTGRAVVTPSERSVIDGVSAGGANGLTRIPTTRGARANGPVDPVRAAR
jgi:hypothetical protein